MDEYLRDFTYVIRNCAMENTYKMGWARAIVEYLVRHPTKNQIHFDELAPLIFKYYWNQLIFFNLNQSPNLNKPPTICQIVYSAIEKFSAKKPQLFTRCESQINIPIKQISDTLKKDVSHRFLKCNGANYPLYDLDRGGRILFFNAPDVIRSHADVLFELINYRWVQKLEECNSSPRISKKVKGSEQENIRRGNLKKFHETLDLDNPDHTCFITGKPIKNLSVDHVIPWSYLYSDDLWNLVYVEKGVNSSKSNQIPDEDAIGRLEKRNLGLLQLIDKKGIVNKQREELSLAIENNYVRRFWIDCKG